MQRFTPPLSGDAPVIALSESGQDMILWTLVGPIGYKRDDSGALARHLRQIADLVEEHE